MASIIKIEHYIYTLRKHRIMLDMDLAKIYAVPVKRLNEQVQRNKERFPSDFIFQLNSEEWESLRSQIATLNDRKRGTHRKYLPFAFTEHGAVMLANVLKSSTAIEASIQVVRAFIHLRELVLSNEELLRKVNAVEQKYDAQFRTVFDAIRQIMLPPEKTKNSIGFHNPKNDRDNEKL